MTSKLSWIVFAPLTLAALAAKVIQAFFLTEQNPTFFGLDSMMLSYVAIGCAVLTFIFAAFFCLIDRKVAPVYKIGRNIFAGVFGLIFAAALACDGANRAFSAFRTMNFDAMELVDIVFTIFTAVVFVVLGLNHFVGNGGVKGLALFYVIPALWSAFRLVKCFLTFTTVSIVISDVTLLCAYIFLTLFLFNYAMIVALMKGKSPVKSTFIFGMPASIMLLCYGFISLSSAFTSSVPFVFFDNLEGIELFVLGLYTFSFIVELSANVKRKDEISIVEEDDVEYDTIDESEQSVSVVPPVNANNVTVPPVSKAYGKTEEEADDIIFSIDDAEEPDKEADPKLDYVDKDDADDYIYSDENEEDIDFVLPDSVEKEINISADKYITKEDSTYSIDEDKNAVSDKGEDWMDHIDKLILEISEDEFN